MVSSYLSSPLQSTPATAFNITRLTNAIPDISYEESFLSPTKDSRRHGIVNQLRSNANLAGQPVRATPLKNTVNGRPDAIVNEEFTPILKSASRKAHDIVASRSALKSRSARKFARKSGSLESLSYAQNLHPSTTEIFGSDLYSIVEGDAINKSLIAPEAESSHINSPLSIVAAQSSKPTVFDPVNGVSLREQEARLASMDKENFGLKLKVHFMEENLKKCGSEYNQQLVKENAELKVSLQQIMVECKSYKKKMKKLEASNEQLSQYAQEMKAHGSVDADLVSRQVDELSQLIQKKDRELDELQQHNSRLAKANKRLRELEEIPQLMSAKDEEIVTLNEHVNELKQCLTDRENEMEQLNNKISSKNENISRKNKQIESLQAKIDEIQEMERSEMEEKSRVIEGLNQQIASLESKLERARINQDLWMKSREKEAENDELIVKEQLIQRLEDEVSDYKVKLENVESEKREVDARLEGTKARIVLMEKEKDDKIDKLDQVINELNEHLAQSDKRSKDVEDRLKKVSDECELLRQKEKILTEANDHMEELKGKIRELEAESHDNFEKGLNNEVEDLRKENKQLADMIESLKTMYEDVKKQLTMDKESDVEAQIKRIEQEKLDLEDELVVVEKLLDEKESENGKLQEQVCEAERKVLDGETWKVRVETMKERLEQEKEEKEDLREKLNTKDRENEALKERVKNLQSDLIKLQEELTHVQVGMANNVTHQQGTAHKELMNGLSVAQAKIGKLEGQIIQLKNEIAEGEGNLKLERQKFELTSKRLKREAEILEAGVKQRDEEIEVLTKELKSELLRVKPTKVDVSSSKVHAESVSMLNRKIEQLQRTLDEMEQIHDQDSAQLLEFKRSKREIQEYLAKCEGEIRYLKGQIKFMKSRYTRETRIRRDLMFEKSYMLMKLQMYSACNQIDRKFLVEMGVMDSLPQQKRCVRPSLKTIGLMVIAVIRMKRWQEDWKVTRLAHSALLAQRIVNQT